MAGLINVVGLLGFEHQAITHLTGTTSMLATAVAEAQPNRMLHLAGVLGAFVLGCMISGSIIKDSTLQLGRHYGVALLLEAALLGVSVPLLHANHALGVYLASCACGLQNAMVSTYSGSVVRTTHLSGLFTDLGIFLGHLLRGMPVDFRRLCLCSLIILAFFVGGIVGTFSFWHLGYSALLIPSGLAAISGLSYALKTWRN